MQHTLATSKSIRKREARSRVNYFDKFVVAKQGDSQPRTNPGFLRVATTTCVVDVGALFTQ